MSNHYDFQSILVGTDFSNHSEAALKQAIGIARPSGAKIVLAHVLPGVGQSVPSNATTPLSGWDCEDDERSRRELIDETEARLRLLVDHFGAGDLSIQFRILSGDPSIALIQAVQNEKFDLVLVGMRGVAPWERFTMGCTSKRLNRNCPSPVWTTNANKQVPPKVVLAATDFSEASRLAVIKGRQIASATGAEFHLLHVIDTSEVAPLSTFRSLSSEKPTQQLHDRAVKRLEEFKRTIDDGSVEIHCHQSFGIPALEILNFTDTLKVDLLTIGTEGNSAVKGMLLGKNAERLLDACSCSILTVKPDDFLSPIEPIRCIERSDVAVGIH